MICDNCGFDYEYQEGFICCPNCGASINKTMQEKGITEYQIVGDNGGVGEKKSFSNQLFFKCKMCGGELEILEGTSICECSYCGSKQTVPNLNDEKKVRLFERANRLRFECEFDKAESIYEQIVSEYKEEAEAYWGILLCKYGIEYVDDPQTGRKIPTCHRLSFDDVTVDSNLENAFQYSDKEARQLYMQEANQIEGIRRKVIEISTREAPYDVFICYKETDRFGNRTPDSVLAQRIYEELTVRDYRAFFSKISLEDKIGQEYEPFIFSALNSAKVMLVVGTEYSNMDAVWVRNEWSRFLDSMKNNRNKVLIPCYVNMDPYDLPKEFVGLQAQDMGKVGAIQDLIRGIEKIVPKGNTNAVKTGITEETLRNALKQEAKKRTIRNSIIIGVLAIAACFAIFAGVSALIEMIKNNKNTTVINNETVVTESTTKATTAQTTEAPKDWKISSIVVNTSESDNNTDMDEIPYGPSIIYFHFSIDDGPSGKEMRVYAIERDTMSPEGYKIFVDGEYGVGSTLWISHYHCDQMGNYVSIPRENVTVEVYNADTNEFLGAKTIRVY